MSLANVSTSDCTYASSLLKLVEGNHLVEARLDVHVLKSIKDAALAAILLSHTGIDRPGGDGLGREACVEQGLAKGVGGNILLEPIGLLGKSLER